MPQISLTYVGASPINYQLIIWHRTGSDSYRMFKSWFCKNLTEVFAILNRPIYTLGR